MRKLATRSHVQTADAGSPDLVVAHDEPAAAGRPRRGRRPETRPDAILDAALEEFTHHGYAAARLDHVARRAGIAKGTIYLYFPNKEALFRASIGRALFPNLEQLQRVTQTFSGSSEDFLRGPFREIMRHVMQSDARGLARVLLTEGHNFPELAEFYYREVVQRGMAALRMVIARGVARGEFRPSAAGEFPQPLIASAVVGVVWDILFGAIAPLDLDRLLDTHVDLLLNGLKARPA